MPAPMQPVSYSKLKERIEKSATGKTQLSHKTIAYFVRDGESIEVSCFGNPVLRLTPEGEVWGSDAGWQTNTTRRRLNAYGWIVQKKGIWHYKDPETNEFRHWESETWQRIA